MYKSGYLGCILLLTDRGQHGCHAPEFPVYTVGSTGPSHSPDVLSRLADVTHGTYSFVHENKFVDAMAQLLAGLTTVAATEIQINIQAQEGVEISSVESGGHSYTIKPDGHSCTVKVDYLYAGEEKNFIVRLRVPQGAKQLMTVDGHFKYAMGRRAAISITGTTGVFVQRLLEGGGSSNKLDSMCPEVEAELTRLRIVEDVDHCRTLVTNKSIDSVGDNLLALLQDMKLQADAKPGAPERWWFSIGKDLGKMLELADTYQNMEMSMYPYMLSWLSSHRWQRATTKGSPSCSEAFQTDEMAKAVQNAANNI